MEGSTKLGTPYPAPDEDNLPWDTDDFWFGPPANRKEVK